MGVKLNCSLVNVSIMCNLYNVQVCSFGNICTLTFTVREHPLLAFSLVAMIHATLHKLTVAFQKGNRKGFFHWQSC